MNALIDDTHGEETDRRPGDGASELNVLVVALDAVIPTRMSGTRVLVVAPALNSWLRRWLSDEDGARRQAGERATTVADRLERGGVHAEGRVGDGDPLLRSRRAVDLPSRRDLDRCPARPLESARGEARTCASRSPHSVPANRFRRRRSTRGNRCRLPGVLADKKSPNRKGRAMKSMIRLREVRSAKAGRLAVAAVAVAAARHRGRARDAAAPEVMPIKHPKFKDGVLAIEGTKRATGLRFALKPAMPVFSSRRRRRRLGGLRLAARTSHESSSTPVMATTSCIEKATDRSVTSRPRSTAERADPRRRLRAGRWAARNDSIDGNRGNDVAFMGAGDDTFIWDPGDGSDVVEARTAPIRCSSTAQAALSRSICRQTEAVSGSSTQATITMDTRGGRVDFNALGR